MVEFISVWVSAMWIFCFVRSILIQIIPTLKKLNKFVQLEENVLQGRLECSRHARSYNIYCAFFTDKYQLYTY